MEKGQNRHQCKFAFTMRTRLFMGFAMEMRMDNGYTIDDMAVVKEGDICIV